MSLADRVYNATTKRFPPRIAGRLDRYRPSFARSWGGPLNGQAERRRIVRDIARAVDFGRVLETGTYRGTSTEFFASLFDAKVATVEAHPRYFTYASARLADWPNVTCFEGDSRDFLRVAAQLQRDGKNVFIYLDAHWDDDLPLAEELQIIAHGFPRSVVMIDDFQVPGDPGYAFDDYGPGKALTASYLPPVVEKWTLLYPVARSSEETGAKRGCCVLVSPGLDLDVASLRRALKT